MNWQFLQVNDLNVCRKTCWTWELSPLCVCYRPELRSFFLASPYRFPLDINHKTIISQNKPFFQSFLCPTHVRDKLFRCLVLFLPLPICSDDGNKLHGGSSPHPSAKQRVQQDPTIGEYNCGQRDHCDCHDNTRKTSLSPEELGNHGYTAV